MDSCFHITIIIVIIIINIIIIIIFIIDKRDRSIRCFSLLKNGPSKAI